MASGPRLTLQQGDRVILIGNTLAERQQYFNNFETTLLVRQAGLGLTLRNLGWSADTLTLQPRPLNFGDAATHLTTQKADVIIAFFGANESFAGEAGLPAFEKDLEAYVGTHRAARYNGRTAPRLALVSPIAHERLPHLVHVDVEARNRELARYTEAMGRVAARLGVPFADVFTPTREAMARATSPLTVNGIHLNEEGDRVFADILIEKLGLAPGSPAPVRGKAYATLKASVEEKNRLFFLRFRPLNAEYVVGRRVDPFGSVSFPPEMKQLDEMIAAQDKRIARDARLLGRSAGTGARKPAVSGRPAISPAEGV
jgi:lysophospholipase L1-like esterase